MALLLALLLLGGIHANLPTDADIAAHVADAIRARLHPASVEVHVTRCSSWSTTLEHLDITIGGFSADQLPLGAAPSPATVQPMPVALPMDEGPQPRASRDMRIKDAHIVCRDFTLKSLPVQELVLDLHEVRLPMECLSSGSFSIAAAESVGGSLLLRQQALTQYLRGRGDLPIKSPEVFITPDGCRVKGTYHMLVPVPVEVTGRIIRNGQAQLCLENPHIKVSVVTLTKGMTRNLLKSVNPLVDLNTDFRLPAPLTITGVTHRAGGLQLDMALQFPMPEK